MRNSKTCTIFAAAFVKKECVVLPTKQLVPSYNGSVREILNLQIGVRFSVALQRSTDSVLFLLFGMIFEISIPKETIRTHLNFTHMKKTLSLLMLAAMMLACTGPQGPRGPQGPEGPEGPSGSVNFKIIDLSASGSQWQYSNMNDNNYYIASFNMPEITQEIYDNGLVQVYREYDTGTDNAVQLLLPNTRHKEEAIVNDEGDTVWLFYSETTDYEYGIGKLNIFFTCSDFEYELTPTIVPEDMHFRCVIMW